MLADQSVKGRARRAKGSGSVSQDLTRKIFRFRFAAQARELSDFGSASGSREALFHPTLRSVHYQVKLQRCNVLQFNSFVFNRRQNIHDTTHEVSLFSILNRSGSANRSQTTCPNFPSIAGIVSLLNLKFSSHSLLICNNFLPHIPNENCLSQLLLQRRKGKKGTNLTFH